MKEHSAFLIEIDPVGRMVIPKEVRTKLGLVSKTRNSVECTIVGNTFVVKRYNPTCIFCAKKKDLSVFGDKYICNECKQSIKDMD